MKIRKRVKSALCRLCSYLRCNTEGPVHSDITRLSKLGRIKTIVDVGVGDGTPMLYQAFPRANLVLVEPLVEYEERLKSICKSWRRDCRYFLTALGEEKGSKEMLVHTGNLEMSSFSERIPRKSNVKRVVPVTTLDDLLRKYDFEAPFGLKVDTEGFELNVVRGAREFLEQTLFVTAEVSILKRFEESYSFEEFVQYMRKQGFSFYDILRVKQEVPTGARFANVVFRRRGGNSA